MLILLLILFLYDYNQSNTKIKYTPPQIIPENKLKTIYNNIISKLSQIRDEEYVYDIVLTNKLMELLNAMQEIKNDVVESVSDLDFVASLKKLKNTFTNLLYVIDGVESYRLLTDIVRRILVKIEYSYVEIYSVLEMFLMEIHRIYCGDS